MRQRFGNDTHTDTSIGKENQESFSDVRQSYEMTGNKETLASLGLEQIAALGGAGFDAKTIDSPQERKHLKTLFADPIQKNRIEKAMENKETQRAFLALMGDILRDELKKYGLKIVRPSGGYFDLNHPKDHHYIPYFHVMEN